MHGTPPRRHGLLALASALTVLLTASPVSATATGSAGATTPATSAKAFARTSSTAPGDTPAKLAETVKAAGTAGTPLTVTLITGDKVTLARIAGALTVVSVTGPDGGRVGARVSTVDDHLYVYPDSAARYVGAGLLDEGLFDVTRLVEYGYDDARSDRLPLIVTYTDDAVGRRAEKVPGGAEKVRTLSSIQGAALSADRDGAAGFWASLTGSGPRAQSRAATTAPSLTSGIAKVWLDGKARANLADTVAQTGAPEVWAAGNTGEGVKVAVLDTGVDADHPDLRDRVKNTATFVPGQDVKDHNGHGTHVASTIAGTGAASAGLEKGVAPGADLLVGKVLDNQGSGQDSWIIAGMEWAARDQKAKIVSMSLGGGPTDGTDPLSRAVNELSAETGALFTIAAGNSGPEESTVSAPSTADAALSVAAVSVAPKGTALAPFSSRGPRVEDFGLKPEIAAPGVDVLAARSQYAAEGEGSYQTMSGTSMATPHVAGAAALLSRTHPEWTGQQLKDALVSSSRLLPQFSAYQVGGGMLDVAAATRNTVFATATAQVKVRWPYTPGQKGEQPVTYTNLGENPVTLDLSVTGGAPEGLFDLSAAQVTVPARGTATVNVVLNVDRAELDGHLSARLDARGAEGALLAHTAIGFYKEGERAKLTVHARDRAGRPLAGDLLITRDLPDGHQTFEYHGVDPSGTAELRLPTGDYALWMWGDVEGVNGPSSLGRVLLSKPKISLTGDTQITLDASTARQVTSVLPSGRDQARTTTMARMDFYRGFGNGAVSDSYLPGVQHDSLWVQPTGAKVTDGKLTFAARWRDEQPRLAVSSETEDFDDLLIQTRSKPLPEGRWTYGSVFAGAGSAAEFAGVKASGKVAVVRWSESVTPEAQAEAAAKAGAKLLLIVNPGRGRLDAWDAVQTDAPLAVASITRDEGERLVTRLQRGSVPLRVVSHPTVAYLYDLVHKWEGAVPADPTYRPRKSDLARVEVSLDNHRQQAAVETRIDLQDGLRSGFSGYTSALPAQSRRTDWVSTDDSVRWHESLYVIPDETQQSSDILTYQGGTTSEARWLGPVQRPRMNTASLLPTRAGDGLVAIVPSWGASGGSHAGEALFNPNATQTLSLYQGDTLLEQAKTERLDRTLMLAPIVSPDRLPYRLVNEASRSASVYPYSTRTLTEWNFTSGYVESNSTRDLPLIQLDYDVDVDRAGRAGRRAELTVTPLHLPSVVDSGRIGTATLDVSYDDGATWSRASLDHGKKGWTTKLRAPGGARTVTLRAGARDSAGNSVTQTIVRAFGLR
ncbi:S8 family serine peptidase [Streptosporangium sp. NPDC023825]|uniref:S8 family peptidase n=1 Tax=Streptosporangium sp. NPDC023825 TaxID=3154909 RepID=UPI00341DCA05